MGDRGLKKIGLPYTTSDLMRKVHLSASERKNIDSLSGLLGSGQLQEAKDVVQKIIDESVNAKLGSFLNKNLDFLEKEVSKKTGRGVEPKKEKAETKPGPQKEERGSRRDEDITSGEKAPPKKPRKKPVTESLLESDEEKGKKLAEIISAAMAAILPTILSSMAPQLDELHKKWSQFQEKNLENFPGDKYPALMEPIEKSVPFGGRDETQRDETQRDVYPVYPQYQEPPPRSDYLESPDREKWQDVIEPRELPRKEEKEAIEKDDTEPKLGRRKELDDIKKGEEKIILGEKRREEIPYPANVFPFIPKEDPSASEQEKLDQDLPLSGYPEGSSYPPGYPEGSSSEPLPSDQALDKAPDDSEAEKSEKVKQPEPETTSLDEKIESEPQRHKLPEEKTVIQGVLKMEKEPESPYIKLTYDFNKLPYESLLSRDNQIFEYAYYKYKPMLERAWEFVRRRQLKKALNYYRTIADQPIPSELKDMILTNIKDINQYMEKFLRSDFQVRYFHSSGSR